MRNLPIFELSALSYHEGVPGHHLEKAVTRALTGLPKFRAFGGYTAFSEGWALFAEQLPLDMGLYDDPWPEFGRLSMERSDARCVGQERVSTWRTGWETEHK